MKVKEEAKKCERSYTIRSKQRPGDGGEVGAKCVRLFKGVEADFLKNTVETSNRFSRPCAQKNGRVRFDCSSIGWIYMLQGVRRGVAQTGQHICFGYRGP